VALNEAYDDLREEYDDLFDYGMGYDSDSDEGDWMD
jgi:hypothetical protein